VRRRTLCPASNCLLSITGVIDSSLFCIDAALDRFSRAPVVCGTRKSGHKRRKQLGENSLGTVNVNGPGEPRFRNNLFVGSPSGVNYGPMKITGGEKPPAMVYHLDGIVQKPNNGCESDYDQQTLGLSCAANFPFSFSLNTGPHRVG
jgi:hypothetical protein